ncbi:hypothetical protein OC846_001965 [Tilletia horrida]|uniref:Uncharacterized protein n=1 Tax=Tilletia horrida TaxID=155126 RepID=A0AAN6JT22_9BASI|nr:hypothetical protein OC846_001965 [Tilletia horrida]KAK0568795.1 hypothetical protein OC861_001572 [Tilletia horrida]
MERTSEEPPLKRHRLTSVETGIEAAGHTDANESPVASSSAIQLASVISDTQPRLAHPRFEELSLLLLQISHSTEPTRFGLVCERCHTAVKPNQLAAHLTRKGSHPEFKAKTKRAMIAKTQTAELIGIANSLIQQAGHDPELSLGGLSASSLLSFEDFFGAAANPTLPRPPLPSLPMRQASKCMRCLRLVSSTHKKAHRMEEHPEDPKDQIQFVFVQAQELARNGAVLFQVFEDDQPHLHHQDQQAQGTQQAHDATAAAAALLASSAVSHPSLVDQQDHDHREALNTVLSAITASAAAAHSGHGHLEEQAEGDRTDAAIHSPSTPSIQPPPMLSIPDGPDPATAFDPSSSSPAALHVPALSDHALGDDPKGERQVEQASHYQSTADLQRLSATDDSAAQDLTDASDPTILSQAAAAAAAATMTAAALAAEASEDQAELRLPTTQHVHE